MAEEIGRAGAMAPAWLEGFFLGWSALPSWLGWLVAAGLLATSYAVAVRTARLSG